MENEQAVEVAQELARDLAALVDAPRYLPGPPCRVGSVLRTLAEAHQPAADTLQQALDNEAVSASAIAELITARGFSVSSQSVSRHRRRGQHNGCRCPR